MPGLYDSRGICDILCIAGYYELLNSTGYAILLASKEFILLPARGVIALKQIPLFLTRYYVKGENPFMSLNDYPFEKANEIKKEHCKRNNIGDFYAEDEYLIHRREIENWIYKKLIDKGGNPTNNVPIYMTLGESPKGEYDIRADIQRNAAEIRIPISEIDLSAITFTFPDSMYRFILNDNGNIVGGERTNTPDVYLYNELEYVINKYRTDEHYIEAQVWNREMLYKFLHK